MQFTTTLFALLAFLSAIVDSAPIQMSSPTTTTIIVPSTLVSSLITAAPLISKRLESKDRFTTYVRHQGGRGGWDLMPPIAKREVEEEQQVCERVSKDGECINIVEEQVKEEDERDLGDCIPGMSWGC